MTKNTKKNTVSSKESAIDSLVKENIDLVKFFVMRLRGLESESIEFNFKEDTK